MELVEFKSLKLSDFRKTWIFDIDGTVLKHNGYKEKKEVLLEGVKEFFENNIHQNDYVLFLTHRSKENSNDTESFFKSNGIKLVIQPWQWIMSGCQPSFFTVSIAPLQKKMVLSSLSP